MQCRFFARVGGVGDLHPTRRHAALHDVMAAFLDNGRSAELREKKSRPTRSPGKDRTRNPAVFRCVEFPLSRVRDIVRQPAALPPCLVQVYSRQGMPSGRFCDGSHPDDEVLGWG